MNETINQEDRFKLNDYNWNSMNRIRDDLVS